MITLSLVDNRIELINYDQGDLVSELIQEVEQFRKQSALKTAFCRGCGACCSEDIPLLGIDLLRMPGALSIGREDFIKDFVSVPNLMKLDTERRSREIEDLASQMDISRKEAVYLYEFNSQTNLLLEKKDDGSCLFLEDKICTIYDKRPLCCALYNCVLGQRTERIYDYMVCQGTWHAFELMGLIAASEIKHNPFVGKKISDEIKISDIDIQLEQSLAHKLFFYY